VEETSSVTGSSLWVDRLKRDEKMMALDQNGIPPDNRQAFFAFPGEGRSCPGSKFAEQEAVLALGTLLRDLRKYRAMSCDQLKERFGPTSHWRHACAGGTEISQRRRKKVSR
jgi:cytochrome P450